MSKKKRNSGKCTPAIPRIRPVNQDSQRPKSATLAIFSALFTVTTCQAAEDTASLLLLELCLQDLVGLVRIGRALGANAALNQALRVSTGGQIILGVSVRSSLARSEEWVSGPIVKECRRVVADRARTFIRAGSSGVEKLDLSCRGLRAWGCQWHWGRRRRK